jgi:hypothetical protein
MIDTIWSMLEIVGTIGGLIVVGGLVVLGIYVIKRGWLK